MMRVFVNRYKLHEPRPTIDYRLIIGTRVQLSEQHFKDNHDRDILSVRQMIGVVTDNSSDGYVIVQWENPAHISITRNMENVMSYKKSAQFQIEHIKVIL